MSLINVCRKCCNRKEWVVPNLREGTQNPELCIHFLWIFFTGFTPNFRLLNEERNSLTSDNFYDYYDYVEYPQYEPESSSSFYNYKRSKVIPESFFPEIKLHNQERGKQQKKHYADYPTKSLPKDKESVRRIDEMPSSFSKGNWMRPPHVDRNRIKKGGNSNLRKYPSSPSRPVRHQGHNQVE